MTATRAVPLTITLSVFDYDVGDNISILITSMFGGAQLVYGSTTISSAPFRLPVNFTIPASNSVSVSFTYMAPVNAAGAGCTNFSFVAQDNSGLYSVASTVSVSIAQNQVPVANLAGPLRAVQDYQSTPPIPLNGTDSDVADANSLQVVITSLPSVGVLYQGGTTVPVTVGAFTITYLAPITANGHYFSYILFNVVDQSGLPSVEQMISIDITTNSVTDAVPVSIVQFKMEETLP